MSQYLSTAVELTFGLALLFIVTKIIGKTQFSQITPFDFISAVMLGELVGNAIYDEEVRLLQIAFATLLWGLIIFAAEKVTQKFKGSRRLLEGEPNIVIHKGELKFETLKATKMNLNRLQSLIRQQGYFSLREIEYAIVEPNGEVSVLPKPEFGSPTNSDFNFPIKSVSLPVTIILDGEVILDNLREAGLDEKWLHAQLSKQGISGYNEVVLAEWHENKPLYVMKYQSQTK